MKEDNGELREAFLRLPREQREALLRLMPTDHRVGMGVDGAWQLHFTWPSAEAKRAFLTLMRDCADDPETAAHFDEMLKNLEGGS